MSKMLKVNTTLIELCLCGEGQHRLPQRKTLKQQILCPENYITSEGTRELAEALLVNSTLTKLDLWGE